MVLSDAYFSFDIAHTVWYDFADFYGGVITQMYNSSRFNGYLSFVVLPDE